MKKLFAILLLCAILTACGTQPVETLPTETTEPVVSGLYDESNPVEKKTSGAVRAYPLESAPVTGMATMGGKLVLFTENEMLTLRGDLCEVTATAEVANALIPDSPCVSVAQTGIAYYAENKNQVVMLNPQLQHSKDYDLPEDIKGKPAIDRENKQVFYFENKELRALNLENGISRLIRTYTDEAMELTGIYFNGAVLSCKVGSEENAKTIYLSTETGQTLYEDELDLLVTDGNMYFAVRQDGVVKQRIVGHWKDGSVCSLNLPEDGGTVVPALAKSGVITYKTGEEGLQIGFYSCISGHKTAQITIEGMPEPTAWHCNEEYVWFVAGEGNEQTLYRWDLNMSNAEEEETYIGPLYTYQNPDSEGLAALKKRVEEMNQNYGVRIAIWEDAMKTPGDYTFKPEHQVSVISAKLDALETILAQFPKKFLQVTVEAGWIRICLVRSIESGEPYVQYWSGGDCYGAISMDTDITTAFLQCAAYGIDSHVMGNSRDFDTWNQLNPWSFTYGPEVNEKYLEGENRSFISAEAMANPHEDRSRIIAAAIMEGNADLFASATMQAKLLRACEGIREAYGLEKSKETYIWEQYLNKSLAYTK